MIHNKVSQRLLAVGAKIEKYNKSTDQCRQNHLFESNQKRLFNGLEGAQRESVISDVEESRRVWNDIWDQSVTSRENKVWPRKVENELEEPIVQDGINIEIKKVRKQVSPGPDDVQGYWIKNLSNLHTRIASQLDRCLQENTFPKWMVTRRSM